MYKLLSVNFADFGEDATDINVESLEPLFTVLKVLLTCGMSCTVIRNHRLYQDVADDCRNLCSGTNNEMYQTNSILLLSRHSFHFKEINFDIKILMK